MSKYININTFEIREDFFEVDDHIAEAISLLNKKGYLTRNSCEGHLLLEEIVVPEGEEIDENWEILCEQDEAYVDFAPGITLPSSPKGWTLSNMDTQVIYFEYPEMNKLKDVRVRDTEMAKNLHEEEQGRGMTALLKWAKELPPLR